MRIQHNIMAMNAYRNYTNNTSALSKNLEKLSSGYRINRAGDDAAGLAISEKMRAQITGLDAASKNVKDGISLVKTAEGATQEIHDMLNRMVYLATQSANGTYQDKVDREAITNEFEQLKSEINRIADSANFNGIKLLDGSLAEEQVADKIEISGSMRAYKSVGSKASFTTDKAFTGYGTTGDTSGKQAEDGDVLTFNIGFDDGTSTSVKMKVNATDKTLTSEDGKVTYGSLANGDAVTQAELETALTTALKTTNVADEFDISIASHKLTLTALEPGTSGRTVKSFDMIAEKADGTQKAYNVDATAANATDPTKTTILGVVSKYGLDEGIEIKADELVEYNGTNYDDAVFTINGKKFVVLANDQDPAATADPAVANQDHLRAVTGLGSDVTILVGGIGGLMGGGDATAPAVGGATDAANSNFAQNIKAIADATGLKVTAGVNESTLNPNGTDGGASPTTGIRLSLGGKAIKGAGLTLQIGDDSEPYNQLKVSIADMHTDALGLDKLSLGTQKGAQEAVTAIKDAINSVSQTRGTLGATQNRLEHTQNNLSVMKENIQDAESTIRDTDVAEEMMAYTKNNILVQSAQAMLAQANQVPQGVLQLLG